MQIKEYKTKEDALVDTEEAFGLVNRKLNLIVVHMPRDIVVQKMINELWSFGYKLYYSLEPWRKP